MLLRVLVVVAVLAGGLAGCGDSAGYNARALVWEQIADGEDRKGGIYSGPLGGGYAVVSAGSYSGLDGTWLAGYWVKDGVAFAANGLAMKASPHLDKSPSSVSFEKVLAAVKAAN